MIFNIYKILEGLVSLWKAYVWDWAEMCLKFIGFKIKINTEESVREIENSLIQITWNETHEGRKR